MDRKWTRSGPEMDRMLLNLSVGKVVVPFVKSFGIQKSRYVHWICLRMHFSQQPYKGLYQGFTGRPNRPSNRLANPWPWYLLSRASWKCETHRSVIFNLISSKLVNSPTALPSKSKSWMVTFIRLAGFSLRSWTLFYWLDSWLIAHESWTMTQEPWVNQKTHLRKRCGFYIR